MSISEMNIKCRCCYAFATCMLSEIMTINCIGPFKNQIDCMKKIRNSSLGRLKSGKK